MGINVYSMSAPVIDMENWPFSFQLTSSGTWVSNDWYVFGCSACAILLNFTGNTISTCSTMCSGDPWDKYCSLRSYTWGTPLDIQLYRLNQTELHLASSSIITVIMIDYFSDYDINEIMRGNYSGVNTTLAWYINDSKFTTCAKAKKNKATYACLSINSECYDVPSYDVPSYDVPNSNQTIGYVCRCSVSYHGNPYLPYGCQLDESFTASPEKECAAKCGSIDVQFPFGMKQGCYRDKSFALACHNKTTTLRYQDDLVVTNISLEEGHLEFNDTANRHYISYGNHYISYISLSRDTNPYLDLFSLLDQHEVYTWVVAYKSCEDAKKDNKTFACVDQHSQCIETNTTRNGILGYRCKCSKGYEGNPYLQDGCRDINECLHRDKYICYGICTNTDGGYNCTCESDSSGDPRKEPCNPNKKRPVLLGIVIGISSGIGLLLLAMFLAIFRRKWKIRKQKKIRENYFRQNHGLLLQQLVSSGDDVSERTKIFSLEDLEKATNNFDRTRVIGLGGHGTVYKGILLDQRVVAIKKSKIEKKSEIDQFINEVAILSQINHRHVVKLFGCCLETEVPLLIYEFISNGTLSEHLHSVDRKSTLSWEDRLRIATEAAGALAYLHSAASMPIFHRDVKSSNILLDDHLTTKISDFGASRFIPLDRTHLVTLVQGTFGYLDPEYYHTGQLTEKSDVYSFGIILLELISGKKPFYSNEDGKELYLLMCFLEAVKENHSFDLVDDRVMKEATEEELIEVIGLIQTCVRLKGVERPTMKQIDYKLQELRRFRITKIREVYVVKGDEETDHLLGFPSYPSSELVDRANEGTSRTYSSSEKEVMSVQYHPS